MNKAKRKNVLVGAAILVVAFHLIGYALLGYFWAEMIALAVAMVAVGFYGWRLDDQWQYRIAVATCVLMPSLTLLATVIYGFNWVAVVSLCAAVSLAMWLSSKQMGWPGISTTKPLYTAGVISLALGLLGRYPWWVTALYSFLAIASLVVWLIIRPEPDYNYDDLQDEETEPIALNGLVRKYLSKQYMREVENAQACQRQHWVKLLKDTRLSTSLLVAAIFVSVAAIASGAPWWVAPTLVVLALGFLLVQSITWFCTFHILTEDHIYLARCDPVRRRTWPIGRAFISSDDSVQPILGKLLGYRHMNPNTNDPNNPWPSDGFWYVPIGSHFDVNLAKTKQ